MQTFSDCFTLVMSPSERDELKSHLGVMLDHVDEHLKALGDIEAQTPEAKLANAAEALNRFHIRLMGRNA